LEEEERAILPEGKERGIKGGTLIASHLSRPFFSWRETEFLVVETPLSFAIHYFISSPKKREMIS